MLNLFPIQFLAPLAYALLRFLLGTLFVYIGLRHIRNRKLVVTEIPIVRTCILAFFEILIGIGFIFGFYTQGVALGALFFSMLYITHRKKTGALYIPEQPFIMLIVASAISLFITGAGIFAFDLPI